MAIIINISVSNWHFSEKFNYLCDNENNFLVLENNYRVKTSCIVLFTMGLTETRDIFYKLYFFCRTENKIPIFDMKLFFR